jgi:hypothetical protein
MVEPVILKFPIPTPEEMADSLGVPRSRIKWLRPIPREQGSLPPLKRKSRSGKSVASKAAAKPKNGKASR